MNALSPLAQARRGARQSRFAARPLDAYDTIDPRAVAALLPHLVPATRFVEPCAGKGDLVRQLVAAGHRCADAFDIAPRAEGIRQQDALAWAAPDYAVQVITNPPFTWPLVRDLIDHFSREVWVHWLLLPASFAYTARAAPLMDCCRAVVAIGRLRWVEDTTESSTVDYAWYRFHSAREHNSAPRFYHRDWVLRQKSESDD